MYAACSRNVGLPARHSVSSGMRECEAANTAFMVGMYCAGSESETDTTSIRECRLGAFCCATAAVACSFGSEDALAGS